MTVFDLYLPSFAIPPLAPDVFHDFYSTRTHEHVSEERSHIRIRIHSGKLLTMVPS